jgi:hypothetical protein
MIRPFFVYTRKMFKNSLTQKIAQFIEEIGLQVSARSIPDGSFLSGILIENGKLLVDENKLIFPGDLLHEAGHLAVAPGDIRGRLSDEVVLPGLDIDAVEAGAIAWSYAAALNLGIDPEVVFHDGGYKGKSINLLTNFSMGVYIGVNTLEDAGMTVSGKKAALSGTPPYPNMMKWLND